jgi:hypothetical protein
MYIYVDYAQHDKGSEKPNHTHTTMVSREALQDMLRQMAQHVEEPKAWLYLTKCGKQRLLFLSQSLRGR